MSTFRVDALDVAVHASGEALGEAAADAFSKAVGQAISERGSASVIIATGPSQEAFIRAARSRNDIAWDHIQVLHMDQYVGMVTDHPASFPQWMRNHLLAHVEVAEFHPMNGDAVDVDTEVARYAALLSAQQPDVCVLGIGENGHLAFNDPPADFETAELVHIVELDTACRMQQVGEGHFPTIDDVPTHAISLTVPALLGAATVLAVVPERRKAVAVRNALTGPVTPDCPASALRTSGNVTLFLDTESASLLAR